MYLSQGSFEKMFQEAGGSSRTGHDGHFTLTCFQILKEPDTEQYSEITGKYYLLNYL